MSPQDLNHATDYTPKHQTANPHLNVPVLMGVKGAPATYWAREKYKKMFVFKRNNDGFTC